MKPVSLKVLKAELSTLSPLEITEICIRLARYKKENKELLDYLLFKAHDEAAYILEIQEYISEEFQNLNTSNYYLIKKMLRKILKTTNRFIKYSGSKQTEIELLIFFCRTIKETGIPVYQNKALKNLYDRLLQRIGKTLTTLHEDLQYDYSQELITLK